MLVYTLKLAHTLDFLYFSSLFSSISIFVLFSKFVLRLTMIELVGILFKTRFGLCDPFAFCSGGKPVYVTCAIAFYIFYFVLLHHF